MINNRTWLAFANRKRCRHADAIHSLGFINWRMGRARFAIGDVVYLFMSDERRVRFKMVVTAENVEREDQTFWVEKAPSDKTYRLELLEEYDGTLLSEQEMFKHGMGEDETGWHKQGHMANILDNLIAQGKCKEMIVVMDNGNCSYSFGAKKGESMADFGASFTEIMLKEEMPYIESTFRVKTGRENTAMAGLSWGGKETYDIALTNLDKFAYIGTFSGAIFFMPGQNIGEMYNGAFKDVDKFNKQVKTLFVGYGTVMLKRNWTWAAIRPMWLGIS